MKKLFSNRSGFTLVEIIVAFAIFAILASMILSMVRITVIQRNSNAEFSQQLEAETLYLAGHYIQDTEKYGGTGIVPSGTETSDGQLTLNFGGDIGSYAINYGLRGADIDESYFKEATTVNLNKSTVVKSAEGLNFFVAEGITYNDPDANPAPDNNQQKGGEAVTARADTRIFGNRYLDYVWIKGFKVDTSYSGQGTRLLIECAAEPMADVPDNEEPYLQYRLHFSYPYGSTGTGEYSTVELPGSSDDKVKERIVYNDIPILECGYLNTSKNNLVWDETKAIDYRDGVPQSGDINPYEIVKTSDSTIRVAIPAQSGKKFSTGSSTIMYVVLDAKLPSTLDASYFGAAYTYVDDAGTSVTLANTVKTDNGYKFYKYPKDNDGNTWLNIYGAFQYKETEKAKES